MFAPLILGVMAIYMFIGWIVLAAADRRVEYRRTGGELWLAVLFWPVTLIYDLISRHGPNRG